jgi:hypothetical protein|tara:strand:+ start:16131 stop:16310 length:180 start_codon:yes stop_codon:yes gene_type:complete
MVYEFNYKDNEGDEFSSDEHPTKAEAKAEWEDIKKQYNGDCHITETWIYDDAGEFKGRW